MVDGGNLYLPNIDIMIDDKKTVEVDYSGMSISILYGMAKQEYKGNEDIYDLSDSTNEGQRWRSLREPVTKENLLKNI